MSGRDLDRAITNMSDNEAFFKKLPDYLLHFEGAGNQLGVVPLTLAEYNGTDESWKKDAELRAILTKWGKEINADSVMVLFGDPRKYQEQKDEEGQNYDVKMFVFEPAGDDGSGLGGGISTMCGNGIRAVACWERELVPGKDSFDILSMSGHRLVDYENGMYTVRMGEFTDSARDLASYVDSTKVASKNGVYKDTPIPEVILKDLSKFTTAKTWSIGLNGTRGVDGKIDGEPHIVIEIPESEVKDINELRKLAVSAGPIVTKNLDLFPGEINVNFIVIRGANDDGQFEIWNCTHERNLGGNADHSVTAACGTGSTVSGGFVLEKYVKDPSQEIFVKNTGGPLEISHDTESPKSLLMKGPAQRAN